MLLLRNTNLRKIRFLIAESKMTADVLTKTPSRYFGRLKLNQGMLSL